MVGFVGAPLYPKIDAADVNAVKDIVTTANQRYALPKAGDYYLVIAMANAVYLKSGDSSVTTTTAVGGFGLAIPEGFPVLVRFPDTHVAYRGTSDAGFVQFIHLDPDE